MNIPKIITNLISKVTTNTANIATVTTLNRATVVEARTATADGTSTGTIGATTTIVTPTCDANTKYFITPSLTPGQSLIINPGAAADYKLKVPTGYTVNGAAATTTATLDKDDVTFIKCVATNTIEVLTTVVATGIVSKPTFS